MTTFLPADRPTLRSAASELLNRVDAMVGPPGRDSADRLRGELDRPVLVAIAGRVNTGKSTLVNAMISSQMAPTSAQETTALLSCYAYGAPSRAEAVLSTGEAVPVQLLESGPSLGGIQMVDVDYLQVFLQSAVLGRFSILDTPGLGSAVTSNSERTEAGLLRNSGRQTDPDVLLYLVRDAFRIDDAEFVSRFMSSGSKKRSLVVGLLAHADNFGGGPWNAGEPIEDAGTAAGALAGQLPQLIDLVPISGLLAETARSGVLREADVRNLRLTQDVDSVQLQFADQLGPPTGVQQEDMKRLMRLIGGYGIRYGRDHCRSSAELLSWLYERSGLARVESILESAAAGPVTRSRVEGVLSGLLEAARNHAWPTEARSLIESARYAPAFHELQEWAALELMQTAAPHHEFVPILEGLTGAGEWPQALTPPVPGLEGYLALADRYQSMRAVSSGAEGQAARVIARSLLIRSGAIR